jgi:hypothetical protein
LVTGFDDLGRDYLPGELIDGNLLQGTWEGGKLPPPGT